MSLRPKSTLAVAGFAIAAMAALTTVDSEVPDSAAGEGTSSPTSTTIDRDAHSFGPEHPEPACKDDTLACAPGHTH